METVDPTELAQSLLQIHTPDKALSLATARVARAAINDDTEGHERWTAAVDVIAGQAEIAEA